MRKQKTLGDIIKEVKQKYNTTNNTYKMFPIGTRVKIITPMQDFTFFNEETGEVISNTGKYLGIIVKFDVPRLIGSGMMSETFNFKPDDLMVIV
jgi:hypothetical protein